MDGPGSRDNVSRVIAYSYSIPRRLNYGEALLVPDTTATTTPQFSHMHVKSPDFSAPARMSRFQGQITGDLSSHVQEGWVDWWQ